MEELKQNFITQSLGVPPRVYNPPYNSLSTLIQKIRKYNLPSDLRKALGLRNKLRSTLPNPLYKRIEYVRYADDWLVGV